MDLTDPPHLLRQKVITVSGVIATTLAAALMCLLFHLKSHTWSVAFSFIASFCEASIGPHLDIA